MSVLARRTGRYRCTHKCVSSKAALLILIWSCPVALLYGLGAEFSSAYTVILSVSEGSYAIIIFFLLLCNCTSAFFWFFFPLAGFLADVKFGRYKTVLYSSLAFLPFAILLGFVSLPIYFIIPIFIGYVLFSPIIIPCTIHSGWLCWVHCKYHSVWYGPTP